MSNQTNLNTSTSTQSMQSIVSSNNHSDFNLIPDHQSWSRSRLELRDLESTLNPSQTTTGVNQNGSNNNNNNRKSCENAKQNICCFKNLFQRKLLYRHVPITRWLLQYTKADAFGDFIAGITVSLAVIPLALAFADIAHLPLEFGLYSSFACNLVYLIFGLNKDNILGSTAIASLLTFQATHGVWQKAVLFTLLTGCIELLVGLLRFNFIIDFVSIPVSSGFTSAIALIIFTSQIKTILGVKSTGNSFVLNWISMLKDIHNYRLSDTLLGCGSVVLLVAMKYMGNLQIKPATDGSLSKCALVFNKIIFLTSTARNALVIFASAGVMAYLESIDENNFILTGHIPSGVPNFEIPSFSLPIEQSYTHNNTNATLSTNEEFESFWDLLQEFSGSLLIVPFIAMLETIAVCKNFSNGKPVDTRQEIMVLGLANIVTSFFQGYRVNGGLARGSVNTASGGRTPFVNFYVSAVVLCALLYFAEYFYFIPKAVLAAIIISAVIFQLQAHAIKQMWRVKKIDLIPAFVAFIACLVLPLTIGISLAIVINLFYVLYHSARPKIIVEQLQTPSGLRFLKLTPDRCLIFPSAEFVRNLVMKNGMRYLLPVVVDCTYIYGADFTAAKIIQSIISDFKSRGQKIIFFNLRPGVARIFHGIDKDLVLCYHLESLETALSSDPKIVEAGNCIITSL